MPEQQRSPAGSRSVANEVARQDAARIEKRSRRPQRWRSQRPVHVSSCDRLPRLQRQTVRIWNGQGYSRLVGHPPYLRRLLIIFALEFNDSFDLTAIGTLAVAVVTLGLAGVTLWLVLVSRGALETAQTGIAQTQREIELSRQG